MSQKAREPRQTKPDPDAAPGAAGEAEETDGDAGISFGEMSAAYEQQIGQLVTQVLQKDMIIRKLQQQLVAKSKSKPGA